MDKCAGVQRSAGTLTPINVRGMSMHGWYAVVCNSIALKLPAKMLILAAIMAPLAASGVVRAATVLWFRFERAEG